MGRKRAKENSRTEAEISRDQRLQHLRLKRKPTTLAWISSRPEGSLQTANGDTVSVKWTHAFQALLVTVCVLPFCRLT